MPREPLRSSDRIVAVIGGITIGIIMSLIVVMMFEIETTLGSVLNFGFLVGALFGIMALRWALALSQFVFWFLPI